MERFHLAHAAGGDGGQLVDACLSQLGPLPPEASFGFVYATDALSAEFGDILEAAKAATGIEAWIGTIGLGICATGQEYYEEPALALMVADFPTDAFQILSAPEAVGPGPGMRVAVVHGDPRHADLPETIAALPQRLGDGFLVGGVSSSRGTYATAAGGLTKAGLSGVVFDERVPVVTGLTQGCSPIGPVRTVDESQANIAIRIDGRPALDVLKEDMGEILARDLNRAAGYIFAGFPIPGSDTGDYLVRNLMGVDSGRGLVAIGDHLSPGQSIMFCRRDGTTAVEDLRRMLAGVEKRLSGPPRGALYHTCLGRGRSLFGDDSEELKLIREALGDLPLVGFYGNGEMSGNRLYGYTGVLTVFQ